MSKSHQPNPRVQYRCRACAHSFAESAAEVVACPRCGSIGAHEQVHHGAQR